VRIGDSGAGVVGGGCTDKGGSKSSDDDEKGVPTDSSAGMSGVEDPPRLADRGDSVSGAVGGSRAGDGVEPFGS
jgi:hypothetical protein